MNYPVDSAEPTLTAAQEEQYISGFHELLTEAIQLRLQGEVPVCCHLSGGLDSSTVAGIMSHLTDEPVHCFSIVFPQTDAEYDENLFATETANRCGAVMHRVEVGQHDILSYLPGEGADECLAGYPHLRKDLFATLPAKEKDALIKYLYRTNLAITGTEIADGDTLCCDKMAGRLGFVPSFLAAKAGIGHKMYRLLSSDMLHACSSHDFLNEMTDHHQAETLLRDVHPVNKSLYLWNKHALCNYILATLGDGCEMSASVEGRLPFLDHRLFEYSELTAVAQSCLYRH